MAFFPLSGVLRGFPPATYLMYASVKTLVRPCSEEKLLISELDTAKYVSSFPDGHSLGCVLMGHDKCIGVHLPLRADLNPVAAIAQPDR